MDRELATTVIIRQLELQEYYSCWQAMKNFTQKRQLTTRDEIWFLQHPPIFTLGQSADLKHLKTASTIPLMRIDRGGQITYHGPGQLIIYPLLDLKRKHWSIREFINRLEQSIIMLLKKYHIPGVTIKDAPGIYVAAQKLCSIGLRVSRGYTFHGLALNVAMDLQPFQYINPCGYENLTMTSLKELGVNLDCTTISKLMIEILSNQLEYTQLLFKYNLNS